MKLLQGGKIFDTRTDFPERVYFSSRSAIAMSRLCFFVLSVRPASSFVFSLLHSHVVIFDVRMSELQHHASLLLPFQPATKRGRNKSVVSSSPECETNLSPLQTTPNPKTFQPQHIVKKRMRKSLFCSESFSFHRSQTALHQTQHFRIVCQQLPIMELSLKQNTTSSFFLLLTTKFLALRLLERTHLKKHSLAKAEFHPPKNTCTNKH